MKILYCILCGLLTAMAASAQKAYFIYLQTDNGSPFYMRMDDKIYSSVAPGYLILPNLSDSTYFLSIGFPSSSSESRFSVPVSGRDRGLMIRNGSEGLGLYDLQTDTRIQAQEDPNKRPGGYRMRNDAFTVLLSKVANDSSLLFVPVAVKGDVAVQKKPKADDTTMPVEPPKTLVKEEVVKVEMPQPKEDSVKREAELPKADSAIVINLPQDNRVDTLAVAQPIEQAVPPAIDSSAITKTEKVAPLADTLTQQLPEAKPYKKSIVKRHSESSTSEGFGLVFYDIDGDVIDTVRLIIPNPKIAIRQPEGAEPEDASPFLQVKKDSLQSLNSKPAVNNCTATASNNDFLKLRRNMVAKSNDDAMLDEAKKVFKNKCFSVEQVRNLSTFFLTAAGKYQLFDAAYLHVTDRAAFGSLGSEIRDAYYAKRFKALIGE